MTVRGRMPFEVKCDRSRSGAVRGELSVPGEGLSIINTRFHVRVNSRIVCCNGLSPSQSMPRDRS